jgi:hypothetical protein
MKRLLYIVLVLLGVGVLPALAGDSDVRGAVWGTWPSGQTVLVDEPIYVPAGKNLQIDPGVSIRVKTTAPLVVYGGLNAQGTEANPITIRVPTGWGGFDFKSGSGGWSTLSYVIIDSTGGVPSVAVHAVNSNLIVNNCRLTGLRGCLDIHGGRLQAEGNKFVASSQFCRTVLLDSLEETPLDRGCDSPGANRLYDNRIRAEVPLPGAPSNQPTVGLWVQGCTGMCLGRNDIWVRSPGMAVGAYFTEPGESGNPMWSLEFSLVSVRSYDSQPNGVLSAHNGILSIYFCTVDVASESPTSIYFSRGVLASDLASVDVKNSEVRLDRGDRFFRSISGGNLSISFTNTSTTTSTILSPLLMDIESDSTPSGDAGNGHVVYGPGMLSADPMFRLEGTWGRWETSEDVYRYFGLQAGSPCIDAGDTTGYGFDPNHTLPDLGRFYYGEYLDDATPVRPPVSAPAEMTLMPPFPNPFNATAVIPYLVSQTGSVRITVYDVIGREVAVLSRGSQAAGHHEVQFGAGSLSSGLYFVTMEVNGLRVASRPLLLIK